MSFRDIGQSNKVKDMERAGFRGIGFKQQVQPETNDMVEYLESFGYKVSDNESFWRKLGKGGINVLNTTMRVLRTGEYAAGGVLSGKGPWKGIKEKISPSEALGLVESEEETKLFSQEGLQALIVDTLLDPTTYLTFGTKGAVKVVFKGGKVPLNKAGTKLTKEVIEKGASQGAAKRVMSRVLQEGGESAVKKYIDKGGLRFMGQTMIPGEYFKQAGKMIGKGIKGTPVLGDVTNRVGSSFTKAFRPFREIDALPTKMGGKGTYTDFLYKPYTRETYEKMKREVDKIKEVAKAAKSEYGEEVGTVIGKHIERGSLTESKMLNSIMDTIKRESDEMLKVERATGKKVGELSNYLKHYLTPEGRKFIEKGGGFFEGLPKPLKAKLKAAQPRKLVGMVSEINNHFKKKYGVEKFFEPDAFKAFAMRKIDHIKYINTYNFLEATKKRFGVPIEKATKKYTDEGIRLIESTNPQLKGHLLPEPIVKHLDDTYKMLTNEETAKGFVKFYDKALAIWKRNVTGIFPAFHTRNFLGGSFNNWLAVGNPKDLLLDDKLAWKILNGNQDVVLKTKTGMKYTGDQILDLAERFGVRGQPGMMDVYMQVDDMVAELTKTGKVKRTIGNAPRWVMEFVEDRLRLPLFIDGLRRGSDPADAAKLVFKYHFDYLPETGLTAFERTWMKRLIPFYTWTRNNVPLQFEQIMKQPGKYANLDKLRTSMMGKEGEKELKDLPDWMQDMFAFKLPWKDDVGRSLWMQLDLPLEDINKLPVSSNGIREMASMLTPFLKFPMERYFNRNMYFGGDIYNPELPREAQTSKSIEQLKHLPEPIKKYLNFRKVKYRDYRYPDEKRFITRYEMDAKKLHVIHSFIGRYYSTLKGLFDDDIPEEWRVSRFVGGIPVRPFDVEEEREQRDYENEKQVQELLNYLKKRNVIPYKSETKKKGGFSVLK
jgi:hypothetical protein